MNKVFCVLLAAGALALAPAPAWSAVEQDHPNFSGNWQLDPDKSENPHTKNLALAIQQDGDTITVTADEDGKSTAFTCSTDGKNCKIKGEPVEVSTYYNGPLLVELDMEHNGDRVIKKRLHLGDDGKTLEMELMRINPPGPTEKLLFVKKQ